MPLLQRVPRSFLLGSSPGVYGTSQVDLTPRPREIAWADSERSQRRIGMGPNKGLDLNLSILTPARGMLSEHTSTMLLPCLSLSLAPNDMG